MAERARFRIERRFRVEYRLDRPQIQKYVFPILVQKLRAVDKAPHHLAGPLMSSVEFPDTGWARVVLEIADLEEGQKPQDRINLVIDSFVEFYRELDQARRVRDLILIVQASDDSP